MKDNGKDLPCEDIVFTIPDNSTHTVGDGHGSTIAIFRRMYMAGFFSNITTENYIKLKEIYSLDNDKITKKHMLEFLAILRASWSDDQPQEVLNETIGDIFGDRGKNDVWTKLLLCFLFEKIKSRHIMGNHDFEIIPTFFERGIRKSLQFSRTEQDGLTVNSANNFFSLLEQLENFEENKEEILSDNQLTEIEKMVMQAKNL